MVGLRVLSFGLASLESCLASPSVLTRPISRGNPYDLTSNIASPAQRLDTGIQWRETNPARCDLHRPPPTTVEIKLVLNDSATVKSDAKNRLFSLKDWENGVLI